MEDEDDMIVIIVGDQNENQPIAMPIKEEPFDQIDESVLDLDLESILETAELHGEYISLINEDDCEFLEVDIHKKHKRKPRVPRPKSEIKIKEEDTELTPQSDSDDNNQSKTRSKQQSYIAQLRKNFPKMRKDAEFLVAHLAEIMKHTKAPQPPVGFCQNVQDKFLCAYCETASLTLPSAGRHYQKRHGSRCFVCYACGANYRCTTGLYKHEKNCASADACLVLQARGRYLGRKGRRRPFLTLNKFDPWDSESKKDKKKHLCSQCTASFNQKDALVSHEYMHRGVRPYQCQRCPVAYTSAIALRRHEQRHTDVQFICDVCGRSFKAKNTLIVHMNTHLPQRKFPCDRCERRFAQKSALGHHINRDHLKIPPPFACAACPKRFPRMSNLKAHMKAMHGLTLMTRQMFFKALPTMKDTELKQATVVFNSMTEPVATLPLGESIFNKNEPRIVDDISTISDEDSDNEIVQSDFFSVDPMELEVVTELVSIEDESGKVEGVDVDEVNEDVFGKVEVNMENDQEYVENEQKEVLGTPYDEELVQSEHEEITLNEQGIVKNEPDEVLSTIHDQGHVKNEEDEGLSTLNDQEHVENEQNKVLSTPIDQGHVKNEQDNVLSTSNDQRHVKNKQEKVLGTSNNVVFRTTLHDNCELEFVKFIAQRGECSKSKNRTDTASELDSRISEIHKNIKANTSRDRNLPVLKTAVKQETKITNKNTDTKKINESASEIKTVNRKFVNKGQTKTKFNINRTPIETRSGVMKTRSRAILKNRDPTN